MKQKLYMVGLVNMVIIFAGAVFKINHFPGAGILLTLGIAAQILVFLPLALGNLNKSVGNADMKFLYIVTYLTCFLVFTAMLFKIQHWPFAGLLLTLALPFPYIVFLPVFLKITSRDSNFSIYNTVFVLLLLVLNSVFSGLLATSVSRDKIYESYNISQDYVRQEKLLLKLPVNNSAADINKKIDELLKTAKEYQEILLRFEGKTLKDWQEHPESLTRPDAAGLALYLLNEAGEPSDGLRLEKGLRELSELISRDLGNSKLASVAPVLFDLPKPGEPDLYSAKIFNDNSLAWSLMYLDGLKTDLLMIRALNQ
jgi:hypothetical protein